MLGSRFIVPYRGIRYHPKEYPARPPKTSQELLIIDMHLYVIQLKEPLVPEEITSNYSKRD